MPGNSSLSNPLQASQSRQTLPSHPPSPNNSSPLFVKQLTHVDSSPTTFTVKQGSTYDAFLPAIKMQSIAYKLLKIVGQINDQIYPSNQTGHPLQEQLKEKTLTPENINTIINKLLLNNLDPEKLRPLGANNLTKVVLTLSNMSLQRSPSMTVPGRGLKRFADPNSMPGEKRLQTAPSFYFQELLEHGNVPNSTPVALPPVAESSHQASSTYVSEMVQMLLEKTDLALDKSWLNTLLVSHHVNLILKMAIERIRATRTNNNWLSNASEKLQALLAIFSYNCGKTTTNEISGLNLKSYKKYQDKFIQFLSINFYENYKIDSEAAIPRFIALCLQNTGRLRTPLFDKLVNVFKNSSQEFQKNILNNISKRKATNHISSNNPFGTVVFKYMLYHHYFTYSGQSRYVAISDLPKRIFSR